MGIKGLVKQFKKALSAKISGNHTPEVMHKGANLVVTFDKRTKEDKVLITDKLFFDISNAMLELATEFNLCMRRSANTRDSLMYTFEAV